jgi:hypothetical protein
VRPTVFGVEKIISGHPRSISDRPEVVLGGAGSRRIPVEAAAVQASRWTAASANACSRSGEPKR